jgi:hypothetical protein
MGLPAALNVALKEWAIVCRALSEGRQLLLLRKGGIYEAAGEFELEHRQFLLFPTYLHQDLKMLKASEHTGFERATAEPSQARITAAAEVTDIVPMSSRAAMDSLEDEHVWGQPLIDMRFNYKPANPLYLLLLRVYRLSEPAVLENTPAYAGCKSWVPLEKSISADRATPVLDEALYQRRRQAILDRLGRRPVMSEKSA